MSDRYDLIVVGAGSAGLAAAPFARTLGARVALVERHRIGGDCTWTGRVPSKAPLHAPTPSSMASSATTASPAKPDRPRRG